MKKTNSDYSRKWREAHPEQAIARSRKWREANPEKARNAARVWRAANREKMIKLARDWRKANSEKANKYHKNWRILNPAKTLAHTKLNQALRRKLIMRKPCAECGAIEVEAHHEDYSKPLDVIWLCRSHHQRKHVSKQQKEQTNEHQIPSDMA